jgi:hypothetical protein
VSNASSEEKWFVLDPSLIPTFVWLSTFSLGCKVITAKKKDTETAILQFSFAKKHRRRR